MVGSSGLGRGKEPAGNPPRAVADRPRGAGHGDGSRRHRVDVGAHSEPITHALAGELRGVFRLVDGEIAVRFVVPHHDDAGQHPIEIDADQHLDGAVIPALQWLEVGRVEAIADDLTRAVECFKVWRRPFFWREVRRAREERLETFPDDRVERWLALYDDHGAEEEERDESSHAARIECRSVTD